MFPESACRRTTPEVAAASGRPSAALIVWFKVIGPFARSATSPFLVVMPVAAAVFASPATKSTVIAPLLRNRKLLFAPVVFPATLDVTLFPACGRSTEPPVALASRFAAVICVGVSASCVTFPPLFCSRTVPAPAFTAALIARLPAPPSTVISCPAVVMPTTFTAALSATVFTVTADASR